MSKDAQELVVLNKFSGNDATGATRCDPWLKGMLCAYQAQLVEQSSMYDVWDHRRRGRLRADSAGISRILRQETRC